MTLSNIQVGIRHLLKPAIIALCLLVVTGLSAQQHLSSGVDYLKKNAEQLKVNEKDLDGMQLTHVTKGARGAFEVAYLQQTKGGISIHNRIINVMYDGSGKIVGHSGTLADNLERSNIPTSPAISPIDGLKSAAMALKLGQIGDVVVLEPGQGAEQKGILSKGAISQDDIVFRLVYQDFGKLGIKLTWEYVIYENSSKHWWQIRIDAQSGQYVDKNDWVSSCNVDHSLTEGRGHIHGASCAEGPAYLPMLANSYNVYGMPTESPSHGGRSQQTSPWLDGVGSPFGWHDTNGAAGAEYTITRGNNVWASEDQDANNVAGFSPDGGATLDFDFPENLGGAPSTYQEAVITNLFYWNNIIHDVLYNYGFDEASGNFQENNYGNGGAGADYVIADALDGSGTNNANFGTPPDGGNPRMQMYVWTQTTPNRTSDYDNGVIIHEYGHGVSNRLTGGPGSASCLGNQEQMGEGWSDYLGLMLTMEPGDAGTDPRGIGTYVLGQPTTGAGIRQYPYSTDLGVNLHTYGDVGGVAVPHGVGSIWCEMLWEMTWALIDQYGFDADVYNGTGGNNIALQLVMDGMKLQPCSPGFVDGRDAILLADQLNNGGANQCLIWEAFAKRGLGFSADQGSSNSVSDGTEAFDTPCFCDPNPGPLGCDDSTACNYDSTAGCNDGSCVYPGCTDSAACNYDSTAGCDDGSCLLSAASPTLTLTTDCWGGEVSWEILDAGGNQIATNPIAYGNQTTYTYDGCMVPGACYTFIIYDSFGDGLSGIASGCSTDGYYSMVDDDGTLLFEIAADPNYGSSATHPFCLGISTVDCNDSAACNYNPTATGATECEYLDECGFCGGTGTLGCMDSAACNYDSVAACDDGSCVYPGCTDSAACNYDSTAGCDDGTCIVPGATPTLTLLTDCWGGEVSWEILDSGGNQIATNPITYGNQTTYTWDGCMVDGECYTFIIYDSFGDGLAGIASGCAIDGNYFMTDDGGNILFEMGPDPNYGSQATHEFCLGGGIQGCTDSTACNYDSTATVDDGSCLVFDACGVCGGTSVAGCNNPAACNFNSLADCDDGSCTFPGCMDSTACNYDSTAGCSDGSCTYPGCTTLIACNYNASAGCDDGSCTFPGCQNPAACNFNPAAGCNDGSCVFPGCMDTAACNYSAAAACDDGSCTYPGCTISTACNYDSTAGCDDGSCTTAGCIDTAACNYDSGASCDDGSCTYPSNVYYADTDTDTYGDPLVSITVCGAAPAGYVSDNTDCDDTNDAMYPGAPPTAQGIDNDCNGTVDPDEAAPCLGDFDFNGTIDVQDLLIFLGDFGCQSSCFADLNGDDQTNAADILIFLGLFGTDCP